MDLNKHGILHEIEERSAGFSLTFIGVFTVVFIFLSIIGAVPDPSAKWNEEHGGAPIAETPAPAVIAATATTSTSANSSVTRVVAATELPVRIVIDTIQLQATISNPTSTDIDVLDNGLLTGAVRYPTSAALGQNGTVLLFGHSSYLPVVHNQAYKTFDGIQNLKTGDEISVYSSTKEYRYRVVGVRKANANDTSSDTIDLPNDAQYLTLITCDSFATKSDRFVVTADFVGTYSLTS